MCSNFLLLAVLALLPAALTAQTPLPRRPAFGVSLSSLSDSARAVSTLPEGTRGVVIPSVTPGRSADAMGIAAILRHVSPQ